MNRAGFTVSLLLAAPLSLLFALRFGSLDTDWASLWQALRGTAPDLAAAAILEAAPATRHRGVRRRRDAGVRRCAVAGDAA